MINFKQFLLEADEQQPEGKPLKHLRHLEDNAIYDGHDGVAKAADFLDDAHKSLQGKNTSTHFSTKYDGAPSIVFGHHPQTGQFFVASKSAFNKNPKINYTHEDIQANHGHAPGLVEKLSAALQHLPKVMPRSSKPGDVYQGDMMYTKNDLSKKNGQVHFTPNTITYSTPEESEHGARAKNAQMGVVIHTKYSGPKGGGLENMSAGPLRDKDREKFGDHPDVHNIDPTIKTNPANYTPQEQREFLSHKDAATIGYRKMKPEAFDAVSAHGDTLENHVNDMIRKGGEPSVEGYLDHIQGKGQKEIDKLKSEAGKDKKRQQLASRMQEVYDNKDHFKNALELHGHLQRAKDVLTGVMAKNNPFGHSIGGEGTDPEGVVAVNKDGDMTKFVNRKVFARQNFLKGAFQKNAEA
jgi:hypothetical protein